MKHTQQELDQIKEYERRQQAGLNPAPLIKRISLEDVAGKQNVERVDAIENFEFTSISTIRGKSLKLITSSKRLLWQAHGQEFIEPDLLDFIDQIPTGEVYFDIGASNGVFALYAASKSLQVVYFEPEAANFSLLNHNTYLNHQEFTHDVLNFQVACSNENGMGSLNIEKYEPGGHLKILDSDLKRGNMKFIPDFKQAALKYRLDDFLVLTKVASPNFLKIDVDGSELQVLSGMPTYLKVKNSKKLLLNLKKKVRNLGLVKKFLLPTDLKLKAASESKTILAKRI